MSQLEYKSEVIIHLENVEFVHSMPIDICIDRDWINSSCISVEYGRKVHFKKMSH